MASEKEAQWTEKPGLSLTEIEQYNFHKFFISDPETTGEGALTEEDLMKAIKCYYNKMKSFEEIFLNNSKRVTLSRLLDGWYKALENEFTLQDVTSIVETYMLEYEMSAVEEKQSDLDFDQKYKGRKDRQRKIETPEVTKPEVTESAKMILRDHPQRPDGNCIDVLVNFYALAENMQRRILYNWKECDAPPSPEKASPDKYGYQEEQPPRRIIQERMDFILAYKRMIRATLMLCKRMKPEYTQSAADVFEKESTYVYRKRAFYDNLRKKSEKPSSSVGEAAKKSETVEKSPLKEKMEVDS